MMLTSTLLQGKALDMRSPVLSFQGHGRCLSPVLSDTSGRLCSNIVFERQFLGLDSVRLGKDIITHCKVGTVNRIRAGPSSSGERGTSEPLTAHITCSSGNSTNTCFEGEKLWTVAVEEPAVPQNHTLSSLQQDSVLVFVVLVGAYIWVRIFDLFTSKKIVGQKLSRKLVHITSGLLYMLCWPFFSSSPAAPFIAGLVPLANGIRLLVYGTGILKDEGLVQSMSRSGDPKELLRGPLYYVLVLYTSTVVFWRQSPVGMIALAMMCGGDGIADIMGRKFGSRKLPYNPDKSWAGSVAMFIFGFLVSFGFTQYFSALGFYQLDNSSAAIRLAVISLAATVVESLPISAKLDDNFTVPATAFVLGILFFPR